MKRFKFMSVVAPILAVVLLVGCGGDERAPYIEALEEADQTTIAGLGYWLVEHSERIEELFEIDEVHVDLDGEELEWSQVRDFNDEFLDHWSFEADGEDITITFVWDYEAATARSPLFYEHLDWAIDRLDLAIENFTPHFDSVLMSHGLFDVLATSISDSLGHITDDEIFFPMTELSLHLGSILEILDGESDIAVLEVTEEAFAPRFEEMREELEALR